MADDSPAYRGICRKHHYQRYHVQQSDAGKPRKIICKTAKLVAGQVDGYRTAASQSIPVEDGMQITFHAMSLPTARLVWHCPFLNVFGADDGKVFGENYHDYMLVRLDGECW